MKKALVLIAALLLTAGLSGADIAINIGSDLPTLELPNIEGKITSLQDVRKNKKTVIVFFTSWSKSSQHNLGFLQDLKDKDQSVEIVGISFDKKAKDVKSFINENKITFPVFVDKKLSAINKFQLLVIPTTFCVNSSGVIEKIFVDYDDNVRKALAEWLKS